jgi:hypothetical protein
VEPGIVEVVVDVVVVVPELSIGNVAVTLIFPFG